MNCNQLLFYIYKPTSSGAHFGKGGKLLVLSGLIILNFNYISVGYNYTADSVVKLLNEKDNFLGVNSY